MKVLCQALRRFPRPEGDAPEKGRMVEAGEEVELNKTTAEAYAEQDPPKVKITDPEPAEARRAAKKRRDDD